MPINPDTYDRLFTLFRRFDRFPEVRQDPDGVVIHKEAWLAFLEARTHILSLANDVYATTKWWRPIKSYFETAPEAANVLLWAKLPETGEFGVTMGWWDDDSRAWYRECEGPDCGCAPIAPTKWMRVADMARLAK